jgi:hypothetical protein
VAGEHKFKLAPGCIPDADRAVLGRRSEAWGAGGEVERLKSERSDPLGVAKERGS